MYSEDILKKEYTLTITKDSIESTQGWSYIEMINFKMGCEPIKVYFRNGKGEIIHRKLEKNERHISNKTLPLLAFQVYERQIALLSEEERENFPTAIDSNGKKMFGIYPNENLYRKKTGNTNYGYVDYTRTNESKFYIYSSSIFSTIPFIQECLKRFGNDGDEFVLIYRRKEQFIKNTLAKSNNTAIEDDAENQDIEKNYAKYQNKYSQILLSSHNIIFRGAPGTGKTYRAKEVAADIISDGRHTNFVSLSEEEKKQVEFVQFHPSYDYTDFVEGLRPVMSEDGGVGFELQDGIFKKFVSRARKNYEEAQKSVEVIEHERSIDEAITEFFEKIEFDVTTFETINKTKFYITDIDDNRIKIFIPQNESTNRLTLKISDIRRMLESGQQFEKVRDITAFFNIKNGQQSFSYLLILYHEIKKLTVSRPKKVVQREGLKNYIFIIDEINRGEMSKIFGELFYALDPGYRGESGAISTQYANMHANPDEKFYIPPNLYIIGTMNDIDRSVDSFDFAMRRRFRFVEIKPEEQTSMLEVLADRKEDAIKRMNALNEAITKIEDLNNNYKIGPSYFLKLKDESFTFDMLWTDYLKPILQDYIHGMYDEGSIMKAFAEAYGYREVEEENNEPAEN